jgi:small subunit ribosomal protein S17
MARKADNEATTRKARKKADTGTETRPFTPAERTAAIAGHRNTQIGTVVKARMQKTVVVAVERLVQHAMYRKTIRLTSTFMAHDEKGAKQGDRVRIVETRPLSKNKRWRVEEILVRGSVVEDAAPAGR